MNDTDLVPPPGGLQFASTSDFDRVAAADYAARHWTSHEAGPLRPGSEVHTRAVARMFRDTFNPYKPTIIDWPELDPEARDRLVNLPIWDIAVQTEGKARIRMLAYAHSLTDPPWREAIELNGWEEGRHKTVLSNLVAAYCITLEPEPPYNPPRYTEWAYLVTGFSECIDSFFAFGLFALAQRSEFFPPELVDTFEPVMQEECRHILLFANWLACHRRTIGWWRRPWFELQVAAAWVFLGWERIGIARGMDDGKGKPQDNNFTVTGSKAVSNTDVSIRELMRLCLAENDRRFAGYDARLLRPTTMPALTRLALRFMRRPRPVNGRSGSMTVKAGSDAHKELFCRRFIETHQIYDPETLPWPELDDGALARLRGVPFWQEVYHTERRAGAIVDAFTPQVADPIVREAVALQGLEETRHAKLIRVLIDRYGLDATEQPLETFPADLETAFIDFGFGECLDAFLGFGAFKTARQSAFLPEAMFEIFDVLMFEETRHIVFFINYMAWRKKRRGHVAPTRALKSAWFYGRALRRLMGMVRRGQEPNDGRDFAVTQANMVLDSFSFRNFVEDCYRENARRMSVFEPDLMQPRLLPAVADLAVRGLRLWDMRRPRLEHPA